MYRKEGFKSFFRGYPISIFMSLYGMISMSIYERSCRMFGYMESNKSGKSGWIPFVCGGISKCATSCFFYPVTVIKTRQQKQRYTTEEALEMKDQKNILEKLDVKSSKRPEIFHTTVKQTAMNILKHEGPRGFYKGLLPNLV